MASGYGPDEMVSMLDEALRDIDHRRRVGYYEIHPGRWIAPPAMSPLEFIREPRPLTDKEVMAPIVMHAMLELGIGRSTKSFIRRARKGNTGV